MLAVLQHRGPDADGFYLDADVSMGSRRLRIIDLTGGDQPIANEDESIWIVYNGELYNDPDLRRMLEARGHRYRTRADTETLLHLYEEYGDTFAEHLNGYFAFAIRDKRQNKLIVGRDYFGIKPLHYTLVDGNLLFASEAKALLQIPGVARRLNRQALHLFLNLRYIPGTQTLFEGIERLPAGHVLVWQDGEVRQKRYWHQTYELDHSRTEAQWIEELRDHLRRAVQRQLVSDVPLGVYLSGGIDSSTVVAFAAEALDEPVKTFSLGFNEPTDELDDAALVARYFGTDHHPRTIQPDPFREFPRVIWHTEEPKENVLQGYLLAQHARDYVTVALSGLGGDELFAGYEIYRYLSLGQRLGRFVPDVLQDRVLTPLSDWLYAVQSKTNPCLDFYRRGAQLLLSSGDPLRYYLILRNAWDANPGQKQTLYGPRMLDAPLPSTDAAFSQYFDNGGALIYNALDAEFHTKMVEDFLNNEDRVSMAHGLEVRVPLLDRELVRLAFSIPPELKVRNGEKKYIFKRAMEGILPPQALRKPKWGFTFNSYEQFNKDLKPTAQAILTPEQVERQGIFNYDYLRIIIEHPPSPSMFWHYFFLWNAIGITIWLKMFMEGDVAHPAFDLEGYFDSKQPV